MKKKRAKPSNNNKPSTKNAYIEQTLARETLEDLQILAHAKTAESWFVADAVALEQQQQTQLGKRFTLDEIKLLQDVKMQKDTAILEAKLLQKVADEADGAATTTAAINTQAETGGEPSGAAGAVAEVAGPLVGPPATASLSSSSVSPKMAWGTPDFIDDSVAWTDGRVPPFAIRTWSGCWTPASRTRARRSS